MFFSSAIKFVSTSLILSLSDAVHCGKYEDNLVKF